MLKNQGNNLAIFGPFLDFQEYFKNRGLTFETSDSDLCDVLNEFFHMNKKSTERVNTIISKIAV